MLSREDHEGKSVSRVCAASPEELEGGNLGAFRSGYEYEIEYEYDFQISNQSHPQNSRFFPLFTSR